MISLAKRHVGNISAIAEKYNELYSRLENLGVDAEDISETVTDLADELSYDEQEANFVEERLSQIKSLKKKYGADEKQILAFLNSARAEYDMLKDSDEAMERYRKQLDETDEKIFGVCVKLTKARKEVASNFCKNVEAQLKTLNIPNAQFDVQFNAYDRQSANLTSPDGADEICFLFSANKGEPQKPLSKVISGGEMSRFMLALKTQLKGLNGISTYIFDEIDAGISGFTARTVAEKFVDISKNTQILAVSHLPQVCAASDSQYLIYKIEEDGKTVTKVKKLSDEEKVDEIVRLTGSINSDAAKLHAKELIEQFKGFKNK
jgi:DNA repair protein RecN (Recombination protein N)